MSRTFKHLAIAALIVAACAAFPALASAGEYEAHCEGAAVCQGTITGGVVEIESSVGGAVRCEATGGYATFASTTTTGTVNLVFTGCREVVTPFTSKCNSPGAASGEIRVSNITYHIVNLSDSEATPGIEFTSINIIAKCLIETFTGTLFGSIEEPTNICNASVTTHRTTFEAGAAAGTQKYTQVTETGEVTDLISRSEVNYNYYTTNLATTWTVHWDHPVKVTCPGIERYGYEVDCQSGGSWCGGTISGGAVSLASTNGETVKCSSMEGGWEGVSGSSVGVMALSFGSCKEQSTIFKFKCSNTKTTGTVETNKLTSEFVNLEDEGTTAGLLLTGMNMTFDCPGYGKKTVTGSILGHIEDPDCNSYQSSHSFVFEQTSHGHQKYSQVKTTGATFDLLSNADNGSALTTTSLTGTGTLTYTGDKVSITC